MEQTRYPAYQAEAPRGLSEPVRSSEQPHSYEVAFFDEAPKQKESGYSLKNLNLEFAEEKASAQEIYKEEKKEKPVNNWAVAQTKRKEVVELEEPEEEQADTGEAEELETEPEHISLQYSLHDEYSEPEASVLSTKDNQESVPTPTPKAEESIVPERIPLRHNQYDFKEEPKEVGSKVYQEPAPDPEIVEPPESKTEQQKATQTLREQLKELAVGQVLQVPQETSHEESATESLQIAEVESVDSYQQEKSQPKELRTPRETAPKPELLRPTLSLDISNTLDPSTYLFRQEQLLAYVQKLVSSGEKNDGQGIPEWIKISGEPGKEVLETWLQEQTEQVTIAKLLASNSDSLGSFKKEVEKSLPSCTVEVSEELLSSPWVRGVTMLTINRDSAGKTTIKVANQPEQERGSSYLGEQISLGTSRAEGSTREAPASSAKDLERASHRLHEASTTARDTAKLEQLRLFLNPALLA